MVESTRLDGVWRPVLGDRQNGPPPWPELALYIDGDRFLIKCGGAVWASGALQAPVGPGAEVVTLLPEGAGPSRRVVCRLAGDELHIPLGSPGGPYLALTCG